MIEKIRPQIESSNTFEELFAPISLELIKTEAPNVATKLDELDRQFYKKVEEDHIPTLRESFKITHENGDVTYIANKSHDSFNDQRMDIAFFVDAVKDEVAGYAVLVFSPDATSAFSRGIPYLDYTMTTEGFQRQGLAERRVRIADKYSQWKHRERLHGGYMDTNERSKALWEKLNDAGAAIKKEFVNETTKKPETRYMYIG